MSAHRLASTVPVTAPAPATAGSLRAPRWDKTGHLPITQVDRRYRVGPRLVPPSEPLPKGATAVRLRSRVSLVGHSERLSETAGKKCVAKCATQFLSLIHI